MVRTYTEAYRHADRQSHTRKKFYVAQKEKRAYKKKDRTPAEAEALKKRRAVEKTFAERLREYTDKVYDLAEDLHSEFPHHSTKKIYQSMMQFTRRASTRRDVNSWNAFQSMRAEEINAGKYTINYMLLENLMSTLTDLPEGVPKKKVHELAPAIREEWNKMSAEEKTAAVADRHADLKEKHEEKATAPMNSAIAAFHDAFSNLKSIETEVSLFPRHAINRQLTQSRAQLSAIHNRTGTQAALVAVRATDENFMKPIVFTTAKCVDECFYTNFQRTLTDYSINLEAYCLSGMTGMYSI